MVDTLPYGSHSTSTDALWARVPVLTVVSDAMHGRVAASLLHAAGAPALVTSSLRVRALVNVSRVWRSLARGALPPPPPPPGVRGCAGPRAHVGDDSKRASWWRARVAVHAGCEVRSGASPLHAC